MQVEQTIKAKSIKLKTKTLKYFKNAKMVFKDILKYQKQILDISFIATMLYSLLNDKKTLKIFGPRTWCTKLSFGYRVVHHGYFLTSCPEKN